MNIIQQKAEGATNRQMRIVSMYTVFLSFIHMDQAMFNKIGSFIHTYHYNMPG